MPLYETQAVAATYHERNLPQLRSVVTAMALHSQRSEATPELTADHERQATFRLMFDDLLEALE